MSRPTGGGTVADVEAYLEGLPDVMRAPMGTLRETIRAAAPDAEEGISYGVPAFRVRGRPLVTYAAAKAHYSFFVMDPAIMERYAAELSGLDTSKGTIRFKPDDPLPAELISRMVRDRVNALEAR